MIMEQVTLNDVQEQVLSLTSTEQHQLAMELAEDNLTMQDLSEVAYKIGGSDKLLEWIDDEVIANYLRTMRGYSVLEQDY